MSTTLARAGYRDDHKTAGMIHKKIVQYLKEKIGMSDVRRISQRVVVLLVFLPVCFAAVVWEGVAE